MIPVLERMPPLPETCYAIRTATPADAPALLELATLAGQRPITGAALIADVGGIPTAALALDDGRVVADPYQDCRALAAVLLARAAA